LDFFYFQYYATPPHVFLTVFHTAENDQNRHDAAIVWAENVNGKSYDACLRELKNFDGVHRHVKVDVLVLAKKPFGWKIPHSSDVIFPRTNLFPKEKGYSHCKTVDFPNEYYNPPTMITTSEHYTDYFNATIELKNNAVQEYVKSVSKTNFEVCLKDIQRYDATHDQITVNYLAMGYYNPCIGVTCPYYAVCQPISETKYNCTCQPCKFNESEPLCDNNDVTHQSICKYKYKVCMDKEEPGIKHYGGCKPFVIQRGRVALRLDKVDVQCRLVEFKASFDANRGSVHLQTTINYFNYTGSFVHDAAVTWVENVNITAFEVCALKAGRAERVTPDGGITFVDYIAFQEAPVDTIAANIPMKNWWEGTQCQMIPLSKTFDAPPYVLVTAEHTKAFLKHDAVTVWVENIKTNAFTVCLRELQNFDGQHKDIKVNWIAYRKLPETLLSQQLDLYFPNSRLPSPDDHKAFCQTFGFSKTYSSAPTVIASAAHAAGANLINPLHNSIAPWIEQINTTNCRVCIKELTNENGYDPVTINMLVIGTPGNKCGGATKIGVSSSQVIPDSKMTASSQQSDLTKPSYGRLNGVRGNGWCAGTSSSTHDWLQVDLGRTVKVCSLSAQGEVNGNRWVTDFKLRYSTDGISWRYYMNANGAQVEFHRAAVANSSMVTVHKLPVAITARYLRFNPTRQQNWNCLRVEVSG
ncbi:unnamed protein product, partial [Porites lobata]